MNFQIETLKDIALLAEDFDLECKKAAGRDGKGELPKDFWPTYSAMANTEGGTVVLGLKETSRGFELHGIEHHDKVRKVLLDTANNSSAVSINLLSNEAILTKVIEGKTLLIINIPRASRQQRPVFLKGNPLGNSYVRRHEADQRLPDEAVKRLLAEQTEDSRDNKILTGFDIDDLCAESLKVYRQVFANRDPAHPWNELETRLFLKNIGAWRVNRETSESGLTAAGLLMFGYHTTIQEAFGFYMLDYQERPEAKTEKRWVDRVTLDGKWSGNLYDFYRKVYPKLTDGVKVPFELQDGQRIDESPLHIAVREALCNVLVHADYSDRASVLVVKRPDLLGFRNPGCMRIPVDIAIQGGEADCRNRSLHQMFRYVGIGDQAGSGIPKIFLNWKKYHWRPPELADVHEPYDQTIMRMRMVDLFPQESAIQLRARFGGRYDALSHDEQVALVVASVENTLNNQRLTQLLNIHPADASRCLQQLVAGDFLEQSGKGRGAVYHLSGMQIPDPADVFDTVSLLQDSPNLQASSPNLDTSSPNLDTSSPNLDTSSPNLPHDSEQSMRDERGRLLSTTHDHPFVDDLGKLSDEYLSVLEETAKEPRQKGKISRHVMRSILLDLTKGQYLTISCMAELVSRDPETLRGQYLTQMVKEGELEIAFPKTPTDPRQAYIACVNGRKES